ncbi:MAG: PPC domain-containing DNA-binding protein [Thermodesulfobacteriota bacterium]|nr:PPC domain-containing DNA-binding protein [Thermodesulfobacteriota bacterium]
MTSKAKVKSTELFMGKLNYGCDLLEELTAICKKEDIRLGRIEGLGAVQKACLGFYDQQKREYQFLTLSEPMEITKIVGNISLKDGNPFVHAHITLADEAGRAFGGHLAPGTVVFACEFIIESLDGPVFERNLDGKTGLPLWTMSA